MRPETKGKATAALVISLLAFGFGTGAGMLTGFTLNGTDYPQINFTQPSKIPVIFTNTTTNNSNQASVKTNTPSSPSSEQVYVENNPIQQPTEPSQNQSNNQTGG
jgi:hypothetical protein